MSDSERHDLGYMWAWLRPHVPALSLALCLMLVQSAVTLAQPWLAARLRQDSWEIQGKAALEQRDYDEAALFDPRGRYGAFDWVAIGTLVVATVIGWGLVINQFAADAAWNNWQGYLLEPLGLGARSVVDGPFEGDLVAGYWLWELPSIEDAVAWVKRCPNPMPVPSEIEIRPI